jgi:molybdopterin-guanine dinucleotide biosynthesis protein A
VPGDPLAGAVVKISAAILAGGSSRRMGTDKAFIDFDGLPLVERIAKGLGDVSDDVYVVAKRSLGLPVRCVVDGSDEQAPLVGVLAALRAARHSTVFICGCDMPFVSNDIVRVIARRLGDLDAVVPIRDEKLEGLHAVWSRAAAPRIGALLLAGDRGLRPALRRLHIDTVDEDVWREIDPEGRAFVNLNTPDDLEQVSRASGP